MTEEQINKIAKRKPGHSILFVYGTLMSGLYNHRVLEGGKAEKIGEVRIPGELHVVGGLPMAIHRQHHSIEYDYSARNNSRLVKGAPTIKGELYVLDANYVLSVIDPFEGHPDWYSRIASMTVPLDRDNCLLYPDGCFGKTYLMADAYFGRNVQGSVKIEHGDYRRYLDENFVRVSA